jgi:hypothetical protein
MKHTTSGSGSGSTRAFAGNREVRTVTPPAVTLAGSSELVRELYLPVWHHRVRECMSQPRGRVRRSHTSRCVSVVSPQ